MSWKCPECGKNLKKKGSHPETHKEAGELDYNAIEEYLSFGPAMGGEISRLRLLRQHDQSRDWDSVYHGYAKESGTADTRRERNALRLQVARDRTVGKW